MTHACTSIAPTVLVNKSTGILTESRHCQVLGYDDGELAGASIYQFIHPEIWQDWISHGKEIIEFNTQCKNGHYWLRDRILYLEGDCVQLTAVEYHLTAPVMPPLNDLEIFDRWALNRPTWHGLFLAPVEGHPEVIRVIYHPELVRPNRTNYLNAVQESIFDELPHAKRVLFGRINNKGTIDYYRLVDRPSNHIEDVFMVTKQRSNGGLLSPIHRQVLEQVSPIALEWIEKNEARIRGQQRVANVIYHLNDLSKGFPFLGFFGWEGISDRGNKKSEEACGKPLDIITDENLSRAKKKVLEGAYFHEWGDDTYTHYWEDPIAAQMPEGKIPGCPKIELWNFYTTAKPVCDGLLLEQMTFDYGEMESEQKRHWRVREQFLQLSSA